MLATDLEHSGSADWTFSFECRFAVFHRDFCGVRIFSLGATFYTIKGCHCDNSPPLNTTNNVFQAEINSYVFPKPYQYIPSSIPMAKRPKRRVLITSCRTSVRSAAFAMADFSLLSERGGNWTACKEGTGAAEILRICFRRCCANSFSFLVFVGIPGSEISTFAFYAFEISVSFLFNNCFYNSR